MPDGRRRTPSAALERESCVLAWEIDRTGPSVQDGLLVTKSTDGQGRFRRCRALRPSSDARGRPGRAAHGGLLCRATRRHLSGSNALPQWRLPKRRPWALHEGAARAAGEQHFIRATDRSTGRPNAGKVLSLARAIRVRPIPAQLTAEVQKRRRPSVLGSSATAGTSLRTRQTDL
jgi:hypothetical protein